MEQLDPNGSVAPRTLLRMEIIESALVPPEYLNAYNAIGLDLARKVVEYNLEAQTVYIQEMIKQQAHDRELEKDQSKHAQKMEIQDLKAEMEDQLTSRRLQFRGQWIATGITLCGLAVVTVALLTDHQSAAIWLGCSMVVALAGVTFAVRLLPDRPGSKPDSELPPTDTAI